MVKDCTSNDTTCIDSERDFVEIYFIEFLVVLLVTIKNLNECVIFEVTIKYKRRYVVLLYRLPSQAHDEFGNCVLNFEQLICDIT